MKECEPPQRAVFLDRDGVLNLSVTIGDTSYPPMDAAALKILPNAAKALTRLKAAGYLCLCVTNQPDVARGLRTRENVDAMNAKVMAAVGLDDIFTCPHDNADNCTCRKPKPGMLLSAGEKWGVDLASSWMVGDRITDVMAGKAAGCRTILIAREGEPACGNASADYVRPDLSAAADIIERNP